jgi:hypothetical protein
MPHPGLTDDDDGASVQPEAHSKPIVTISSDNEGVRINTNGIDAEDNATEGQHPARRDVNDKKNNQSVSACTTTEKKRSKKNKTTHGGSTSRPHDKKGSHSRKRGIHQKTLAATHGGAVTSSVPHHLRKREIVQATAAAVASGQVTQKQNLDHETLAAAAAVTSELKTFRQVRRLVQNMEEECSRIPEDEEATIDLPGAHAISATGTYVPHNGWDIESDSIVTTSTADETSSLSAIAPPVDVPVASALLSSDYDEDLIRRVNELQRIVESQQIVTAVAENVFVSSLDDLATENTKKSRNTISSSLMAISHRCWYVAGSIIIIVTIIIVAVAIVLSNSNSTGSDPSPNQVGFEELIKNGSFEDGTCVLTDYYETHCDVCDSCTSTLTGWTVEGTLNRHNNVDWNPNDGDFSIDLINYECQYPCSDVRGSLQQSFRTVIGKEYVCSLSILAPGATVNSPCNLDKRTANVTLGDIKSSFTISSAINEWERHSITFVASSATTAIKIKSGDPCPAGFWGIAVDSVSCRSLTDA